MPYVIGTAGHVDHGKSTLVKALTGIDPDRLAEEKAREMTIDLGFAWLTLPSGQSVGIVDVPGHQDFIENMLAGVGGIDLALLVVAVDEGIMPQTREHLAILDLLEVSCGVVALTKIDLLSDREWLELVWQDVAEALEGTTLEQAPIIPLSARTGEGLSQLVDTLDALLAERPPRPDRGRPRLPVDRVFTISGFGTVVTGTLTDGSFTVGDEVEILPAGKRARIRGLQSHKETMQVALPGSRVAINLGGVTVEEIKRGDVVAKPGLISGTTLVDVQFRHLADAERALRHNAEVKFFSGAAETVAHVRLLGDRELSPGTSGWLQLRLEQPVPLDKGDRYILRYPSPPQTIGGGIVLDPHPPHRWRRFKPEVLARFETLLAGSPEELLLRALEENIALTLEQLAMLTGLTLVEVETTTETLKARGDLSSLPDGWLMAEASWRRIVSQMRHELEAYHRDYPLRHGMPREALRSRLSIDARLYSKIVEYAVSAGQIISVGTSVRLPEHAVRFSTQQQAAVDKLWATIRANPVTPPSTKEAAFIVGEDVLQALFERGDLVSVSEDVFFDADTYMALVERIRGFIAEHGSITVAQARDLFGTSRKYVLALLEHLDAVGMTKRIGDERVLTKGQDSR
jgi:selenocysteine-specific elongation factor